MENKKTFVGLTFENKDDVRWIRENMPWIFGGGLMLVEKWPTSGYWEDAKFSGVSCWVKMVGFPLSAFTESNIRKMGKYAGEVLEVKWRSSNQWMLQRIGRAKFLFLLNRSIFVGKFILGEREEAVGSV